MAMSLKKAYIKALKEEKYFFSLLPEEASKTCRYTSCKHKAVKFSLLCAKHHFEMVTKLPCPWVVSEDGLKVIKVLSYYVMDYAKKGGKVGARIGIILLLLHASVNFYVLGNGWISIWLLFFIVIWGQGFLDRVWTKKYLPLKYILPGMVIVSCIHFVHPVLLNVLLDAWKAHLIIAVIGAMLGIFPGIITGSIFGTIRNKYETPPHEDPTGQVWIKGILLPTTCLSVLLILYTRYCTVLSAFLNITFL